MPLRVARIIRLDGLEIPVEVGLSLIEYDGLGAIQAIIRDISERKRSEESLREIKDYLENLINHANAPIIVWDSSFIITRFNNAFEKLTGLKASEVVGKYIEILFPDGSKKDSMNLIESTLAGERWEAVEIPIYSKGRKHPYSPLELG